jgi:diguanylate cyclase
MDIKEALRSRQEAVERFKRAEAHWSLIDVLLRRLSTCLSNAADGRTAVLDNVLAELRQRLREPVGKEALEGLLARLTKAARSLDELPPAHPASAQPTELPAARLLLVLIERLRLDGAPAAELVSIREAIVTAADDAALAPQAEALAELVNRYHRQLGEHRAAAERLLDLVHRQLDELARYLRREHADHRESSGSRQELDRDLTGEIDGLGSQMEQAQDLHTLHQAVQSRLGAITAYLKSFREREDARERDWQARSAQMNQRILELEHSARTMEASLRQEHELASTDPLTGLANRLVFERHMATSCLERARGGAEACLLVLDIDRFKHINDNFGHAAGDRALRIVAEQLKAVLRPEDVLARYGGEEFVAVLPNTGVETGREIAEALRNCIESIGFRGQQRPVRITLSCGITALRADDTPESAFERADRALYQAKHGGRNRCEIL